MDITKPVGALDSPRTRTAHEYALKTIRDAILSGELRGNTHLIQTELAEQLEISITPVREALRDLATEGLVTFDAHHGALVRTLDLGEVQELYELRSFLEPKMAARVLSKVSSEDLRRARDIQERMQHTTDLSDWVDLNRHFHSCFAHADQQSRLFKILKNLRDSAAPYVNLSLRANKERVAQSNVEHTQLIRLYEQRDLQKIIKLTVQHLNTTLQTIEEAYSRGQL